MNHTPGHIDCPACEAARHTLSAATRPYQTPLLEEHSGAGGNDAGHAGNGMTLAAQVFSNYVLLPARRHPDGHTRAVGLHGAGLLVFGDETAEQVQLRTGDAAGVTQSALVSRENVSNETVSGHDLPPENRDQRSENRDQKEGKMTTTIACSVCHAAITPGATVCPGCGLPLVAQAVPVVTKKSPLWWFVLKIILGIGVLAMVAQAFSH